MADMDSLVVRIKSDSTSAVSGIDALATSLGKLKTATSGGLGLSSVANNLTKLGTALSSIKGSGISEIGKLGDALSKLSGMKVSSTIGKNITAIGTAMSGLNIGDGASKITGLVEALKPLETLGKSSLSSTVNALNKLPEALKKIDMRSLYSQVSQLTRIMKPLADEMQKVANGFNAFPSRIQKLIRENEKLDKSNDKTTKSYINMWAKMRMAYNTIKTGARVIGNAIKKSTEYVENLNLFNVSMGEYAKEAQEYADTVGEIMGIDPAEWMRNQGLFMTLATGFGVTGERAKIMSKNLTQLGYDLSSFFNISYEDAMLKLQSGLAGELEPLRRIGYDLSVARLQQEAYTLGINKKVSAMNQAEKAELRYYAIMTQVTRAQGDMSRTLDTPANQLRILKSQFAQAGRALGNIFIPALNAVLPWVIALTKVLRILADAVASLFGFEIPEIDYSGLDSLSSSSGDVAESLGEAGENAKKLKKYTMGFDEFNIIDTSTGSGSDKDDAVGIGGLGFDLPEYDFIGDAVSSNIDKIMEKLEPAVNWLKENMDIILVTVGAIGAGILAWKIGTGVAGLATAIKDKKLNTVAMGITMMVTGIALEFHGAYKLGMGDTSNTAVIETLLGTALGVAGTVMVLGSNPLGWTVAIGLAITALITGFTLGKLEKAKQDDLASRFGDYVLSDMEREQWVSMLTENELSVKLSLFVDSEGAVKSAKTQVESAINKLNDYNFRIKCGLEVTQEEYQKAVDEFVSSAQTYLENKQVSANIAIDLLLGDTATGTRLTEFANGFYSENLTTLDELGKKLKQTVAEGFVDGEWIDDKFQEAIKLQREIQEIMDYVSDVEFKAELKSIELDYGSINISAESFKGVTSDVNNIIQSNIEDAEGVRLESLKIAQMEFDENIKNGMSEDLAKELYNTTVDEINKAFLNRKFEITAEGSNFSVDKLMTEYSDALKTAEPYIQKSAEDWANRITSGYVEPPTPIGSQLVDWLKAQTGLSFEGFWGGSAYDVGKQLMESYQKGIADVGVDPAVRDSVAELLVSLKPTKEEYEDIVRESIALGTAVPEGVREGLNDIYLLKAIGGDVDAMNYLIGQKLSTDTSFLELLAVSEDAGKNIDEAMALGLLTNVDIITDEANKTVTLMNDTIGVKVLEITPTLVANFKKLGVDLSSSLYSGADAQMYNDRASWYSWSLRPLGYFEEQNKIESPSKAFYEAGEYVSEGLLKGAEGKLSADKAKWFSWATKPLEWFKEKNDINSPSREFDAMGGFIAQGLFNGVDSGLSETAFAKIFDRLRYAMLQVKTRVHETTLEIRSYFEEMVTSVVDSITIMIDSFSGMSAFGITTPTYPNAVIPQVNLKAEGCTVDGCRMVIGGDTGVEIVSGICRKAVVENYDLIVKGVEQGVAEGNSESNALLREQNDLLRAMLQKENTVSLDGRTIAKSVEAYQRTRGTTIVVGGAY